MLIWTMQTSQLRHCVQRGSPDWQFPPPHYVQQRQEGVVRGRGRARGRVGDCRQSAAATRRGGATDGLGSLWVRSAQLVRPRGGRGTGAHGRIRRAGAAERPARLTADHTRREKKRLFPLVVCPGGCVGRHARAQPPSADSAAWGSAAASSSAAHVAVRSLCAGGKPSWLSPNSSCAHPTRAQPPPLRRRGGSPPRPQPCVLAVGGGITRPSCPTSIARRRPASRGRRGGLHGGGAWYPVVVGALLCAAVLLAAAYLGANDGRVAVGAAGAGCAARPHAHGSVVHVRPARQPAVEAGQDCRGHCFWRGCETSEQSVL